MRTPVVRQRSEFTFRDCNPGPVLPIPGFGNGEFVIRDPEILSGLRDRAKMWNLPLHRESKKQDTKLLAITSTITRFFKISSLADSVVNLQQNRV